MCRLSELKGLSPGCSFPRPAESTAQTLEEPLSASLCICSPIPILPVTHPSYTPLLLLSFLRLFQESCKGPYCLPSFPKNHLGKIRPVPLLSEVPISVCTGQGTQNATTRERMNKQVSALPLWSACTMQLNTDRPLTLLSLESSPSSLA